MKAQNPFKTLTKFEIALWSVSAAVVTLSFLLAPNKDYLTLAASLAILAGCATCLVRALLRRRKSSAPCA